MCKISVIMSAYNETELELKKAIESILNQTFKDFEFLIISDNPTNNLINNIIKEYEKKDERIKVVINDKNIGLAKSLNKCLQMARGKYIARMDADDISMPNRLEKQYEFLEKNVDLSIVSTNKTIINENDDELYNATSLPTKDLQIKKILKYTNIIIHPSVMFRKEDIKSIGYYRNFKTSQDYDLWLRASSNNLKFGILDEYLIKYRVRENNISNSNPLKQWTIHEYILELHKERLKNGKDSFSEEELEKKLEKNKASEEKNINAFKKGMNYIELLKKGVKSKKISSIKYLLFALIAHKKIRSVLNSYFKSYFYKNE